MTKGSAKLTLMFTVASALVSGLIATFYIDNIEPQIRANQTDIASLKADASIFKEWLSRVEAKLDRVIERRK